MLSGMHPEDGIITPSKMSVITHKTAVLLLENLIPTLKIDAYKIQNKTRCDSQAKKWSV